ncbi:MAG TPA: GNAT family N-acetyltransferase [Candidatus Saccharimonadia bacterium]|nr:GNAT family N-acetyltransferase [Candidatus Saccharimonadia bacterium]
MAAPAKDPSKTNLPIAVRRAQASDKDVVLSFATRTWDGWDYIPEVWDDWLVATDGVLLVATAQADDRPIALTRLAMLSDDEGWLEGIRVDPAVRGRGVATNLQIAELSWARAHHLRVLRYMTGQGNEGSLKLGAHHGFAVVGDRRFHGRPTDDAAGPGDRTSVLDALQAAGVLLPADSDDADIEGAWSIVDEDATFRAGGRLYEIRPWALQWLDRERFAAHVRAGEVLFDPAPAAVAIMPHIEALAEDDHPHLALLAGDGLGALRLMLAAETAAGQPIGVRMIDPAPMFEDAAIVEAWHDAGLKARDWAIHVLERQLPPGEPLPSPEPDGALVLRDPPGRTAVPPHVGHTSRTGAQP